MTSFADSDVRLDRQAPLPLYFQLQALIEERIDSGEWKPGELLPSERELCEQLNVSRITVRQAVSELVRAGRLVRDHGRGTFVAQPRLQQRLTHLTSFTQDMQTRHLRAGSQVLMCKLIPAPQEVARALKLKSGAPVIYLKRLRLADGELLALEMSYLPDRLCHGLLDENLQDRSLYQILTEQFNILPYRAEQQLEAMSCPAAEAKLLGIRKGSPVLHIYRTTFTENGQAFERVESYYRGDKYVFNAELHLAQE